MVIPYETSKKPKKSPKSRVLRDSFEKKFFDVETPRLSAKCRCEVRQNSCAEEDYTPVFLGHARLYVFADKWGIEALKTLSLHKLHKTLVTFTPYSARLGDVAELVRYTYKHTPDFSHEIDDLRFLVMDYLTCEVTNLIRSPEFEQLLEQGGPFAQRSCAYDDEAHRIRSNSKSIKFLQIHESCGSGDVSEKGTKRVTVAFPQVA